MASPEPFPLSPLDNIMPRRYTLRLLCFPTEDRSSETITNTLKLGLAETLKAFPLLRGTVKPYQSTSQAGRLCITEPWKTLDDIFFVIHQPALDYEELRNSGFAMTYLKFNDMFPIHGPNRDLFGLENPVIMVQVTFAKGGMIMATCLHHSFVDGTGSPEVLEVWAAFCRGEHPNVSPTRISRDQVMTTAGDANLGNFFEYTDQCSPGDLISYAASGSVEEKPYSLLRHARCFFTGKILHPVIAWFLARLSPFISSMLIQPIPQGALLAKHTNPVSTEIFFFPKPLLLELKSLLATHLPPSTWISTNDALSALCGACLTTARKPSMPSQDPEQELQFVIAVDGRRLTNPPLPKDWIGNVSLHGQVAAQLFETQPTIPNVAKLGLRLRKRLQALDTAYIEDFIASLAAAPDISRITPSFASLRETGRSVLVLSWATQGFYQTDWGKEIGVKCERLRVPKFEIPRYNGACIILPEVGKGGREGEEEGLEVMIGLEWESMKRLKENELWGTFGRWRCD